MTNPTKGNPPGCLTPEPLKWKNSFSCRLPHRPVDGGGRLRNACRVRRIWIPSADHPTASETTSLSLPDGRAGWDRRALLHAIGQEKRPVLLEAGLASFLLLVRLVDNPPFAFIGLLPQLASFFIRLDLERLKLTLIGRSPGKNQMPCCSTGLPACVWFLAALEIYRSIGPPV